MDNFENKNTEPEVSEEQMMEEGKKSVEITINGAPHYFSNLTEAMKYMESLNDRDNR